MIVIKRIRNFLSIFFETISVTALVLIVILLILQVLFRYVLKISVPWTEELARYLTIWMVYLGVALAFNDDDHVKIDFFIKKIKNKKLINIFEYLKITIIFIFVISLWLGASLLVEVGMRDWASTFDMRMSWVYLALPVSIIIVIILIVLKILTDFLNKSKNKNSI